MATRRWLVFVGQLQVACPRRPPAGGRFMVPTPRSPFAPRPPLRGRFAVATARRLLRRLLNSGTCSGPCCEPATAVGRRWPVQSRGMTAADPQQGEQIGRGQSVSSTFPLPLAARPRGWNPRTGAHAPLLLWSSEPSSTEPSSIKRPAGAAPGCEASGEHPLAPLGNGIDIPTNPSGARGGSTQGTMLRADAASSKLSNGVDAGASLLQPGMDWVTRRRASENVR